VEELPQELDESPLLLERAEQRAQALDVPELGRRQEVRGPLDEDARGWGLGLDRARPQREAPREEAVARGRLLRHPAEERLSHRGKGRPRELLREIASDAVELALVERLGDLEHPVVDHSRTVHEDRDDPAPLQPHELEVLDHDGAELRRQRHADVMGEPRELTRRLAQQLRQLAARAQERLVDRLRVGRAHANGAHELIHVESVRAVGRYAPRRGVRLREQAALLEVGHDVADRGGGEVELRLLRERPAPDRLPRHDVRLDHGLQDLALARVEAGIVGAVASVPTHARPPVANPRRRARAPAWTG
jgi:hypothetical protein